MKKGLIMLLTVILGLLGLAGCSNSDTTSGNGKGDKVEITSRYGTLQGKARVTSSPREGVVFTTFHDAKLLINRVVADNFDPISKEPEYKVTAVSLRKVVP